MSQYVLAYPLVAAVRIEDDELLAEPGDVGIVVNMPAPPKCVWAQFGGRRPVLILRSEADFCPEVQLYPHSGLEQIPTFSPLLPALLPSEAHSPAAGVTPLPGGSHGH